MRRRLPIFLIIILCLTITLPEAHAISRSTEEAYEYAAEHLDKGHYIHGGLQHYFVDLHYYIGIEEKEDKPKRGPVKLFHSMADHYGEGDGKATPAEKQELAELLDEFIPKLADFEYGNSDGNMRMSEYEAMITDLRKNKTFDTARRFAKEYTYYKDIRMDDREEVRRYLSPYEIEGMYKTFKDANSEVIEERKQRDFPYFDLDRVYRERVIEEMLDAIFEEFKEYF